MGELIVAFLLFAIFAWIVDALGIAVFVCFAFIIVAFIGAVFTPVKAYKRPVHGVDDDTWKPWYE